MALLAEAGLLHGGISDEHSPHVGAGLGNHQHSDEGDGVRPQHNREPKLSTMVSHIQPNALSPCFFALL